MCGIVGYITTNPKNNPHEKREFQRDSLIVDSFRGFDSTGMLTVCEGFEVAMHKAVGPGYAYVLSKEFAARPTDPFFFVGHNRKATKGVVNKSNAHPFVKGPITMVHNGTLSDHGRSLPHSPKKKLDVDSAMIAYNLAQTDADKAVEVIREIRGSYALVWTDTRDQSLNIVRNVERPLHFAFDRAKNTMYFMSDGAHLHLLSDRSYFGYGDLDTIYQFAAKQLLKFKVGSLVPEVTEVPLPFVEPSAGWWRGPSMKPSESGITRTTPTAPRSPTVLGYPGSKRSLRTTRERSPRSVPSSHRISLLGQDRPIIGDVLETLEKYDMDPAMNLKFKAKSYRGYTGPEKMGLVWGEIEHPEWGDCVFPALLHNVPQGALYKMDKYWTVRPIDVLFCLPDSENNLGFLCNPINYEYVAPDPLDEDEDEELVVRQEDLLDEGKLVSVVGPHGQIISLNKFYDLTQNGCSRCYRELKPEEYEEIWWMGEGEEDPMCGPCAEECTHPATKDEYVVH